MNQPTEDTPPSSRVQQAEAVLLRHIRGRRQGDSVSDDELLAAHPQLSAELQEGLKKASLLSAAFAKAAEPAGTADRESNPKSVSCPACHAPIDETVAQGLDDDTAASVCGNCGRRVLIYHEPLVDRVAHFELIERLGSGGFGTVWRALDTRLDREVAVKVAKRHAAEIAEENAFFREAKAAAQLHHPHIVATYEVGQDGDTAFIASELVDGLSLRQRLDEGGFSAMEAAEICCTIARAVHYAHVEGVIHRDLKPHNVLLDHDGQPHIADFGLARRDINEITVTLDGQIVGTPAYMSPEQAMGDSHSSDRRSDVYALGVILFELLTGELPFRGSLPVLVQQVLSAEPARPRSLQPRIPRDLETICLKCLEKRPDDRYQTAELLACDLQRFLATEPIHARPVGYLGRAARWCQRKPAVATLVGLLILAIATGFAGITWKWREASRALVQVSEAQRRAQDNLQAADRVVDEFLITVADDTLLNQPHTEHLRRQLLEMGTTYYAQLADSNTDELDVALRAAMARAKLGKLAADMGSRDVAIEHLDEAIAMLRKMDSRSVEPHVVPRHLCRALLMKGQALISLRLTPEAAEEPLDCFLQAKRHFDQSDFGHVEVDDLRAHAELYRALANGYQIAAQPNESVENNILAIDLWQQVIDRAPDDLRALSSLASRHSLLAALYQAQLNFVDAPRHHQEAIELMRHVVSLDPSPQNKQRLASALVASKVNQNSSMETQVAILILEEAAAIQTGVAGEYPLIRGYQRSLLMNLCLLGNSQIDVKAFDDAHANFDQMLDLIERLRNHDPQNPDLDVHRINALFHKALAFKKAGDNPQAKAAFEVVASTAKSLSAANPSLVEVAIIHSSAERNIASILAKQDLFEQAADHFQQAITIAESVLDVPQRTNMVAQILILGRDEISRVLLEIDPARSQLQAELGLGMIAKLRAKSSGQYTWLDSSEAILEYDLGRALMARGQHADALHHLSKAAEKARVGLALEPGFENILIHVVGSLVEVHLRLGRVDEAIASTDDLMANIESRKQAIRAVLVVLDRALQVVADDELLDVEPRRAFVTSQTSRAAELLREGLDAGLVVGDTLTHLRQSSPAIAEILNERMSEEPQSP